MLSPLKIGLHSLPNCVFGCGLMGVPGTASACHGWPTRGIDNNATGKVGRVTSGSASEDLTMVDTVVDGHYGSGCDSKNQNAKKGATIS